MLHWISANLSTILITLVLIAIVVLIIRSLIRQKKQGKSSCGAGCAHWPCMAQCAQLQPQEDLPCFFCRIK